MAPADPDRLDQVADIPTIGLTCELLVRHLEASSVDLRDTVDLVSADPGLVGRLLRVTNAPYFGLSRRVGTISQATGLLSQDALRTVCMTAMVAETARETSGARTIGAYRAHAVATAVAARCLGARLGCFDPDEVYVAGLLHNIGELALPDTVLPKGASSMARAELAGRLLEGWGFPAAVVDAVLHHRMPAAAESNSTRIVWLARQLVDSPGQDAGRDQNLRRCATTVALADVDMGGVSEEVTRETARLLRLVRDPEGWPRTHATCLDDVGDSDARPMNA